MTKAAVPVTLHRCGQFGVASVDPLLSDGRERRGYTR